MKTVARKFDSDREMSLWLSDPKNLDKLKEEYPSTQYSAELNLMDKEVIVTKKN